jgi:hypothetical protein
MRCIGFMRVALKIGPGKRKGRHKAARTGNVLSEPHGND